MRRDPKAFRERFAAWKNGEQVYDAGRIVDYAGGKDALPGFTGGYDEDALIDYLGTLENPTKHGLKNGIWRPPTDSTKWDVNQIGMGLDMRQEHNPIVYNFLKSKGRLNNPYLTESEERELRRQTWQQKKPILERFIKDKDLSERGILTAAGMLWQGHPYKMMNTPDSVTGKALIKALETGDRDLSTVFDAYYKYPANAKRYASRINSNTNWWNSHPYGEPVEDPVSPTFSRPAPPLDFTAPRVSTDVNQPFRRVAADNQVNNTAGWKALNHFETLDILKDLDKGYNWKLPKLPPLFPLDANQWTKSLIGYRGGKDGEEVYHPYNDLDKGYKYAPNTEFSDFIKYKLPVLNYIQRYINSKSFADKYQSHFNRSLRFPIDIDNVNVNYISDSSQDAMNLDRNGYYKSPNEIKIGTNWVGNEYGRVIAHEVGHAIDDHIAYPNDNAMVGDDATYSDTYKIFHKNKQIERDLKALKEAYREQPNMFITPMDEALKYSKRFPNSLSHDAQPRESYGDLMEFRWELYNNGIYDSTLNTPAKMEHIKKYKDSVKYKNRLFKYYSDEDILNMLNTVAQNTTNSNNELLYAKRGKDSLPCYTTGEDGGFLNWLKNALIGASVADAPAVATASGWHNEDGQWRQNRTAADEQLGQNLDILSTFSRTNPINVMFEGAIGALPYIINTGKKYGVAMALNNAIRKGPKLSITKQPKIELSVNPVANSPTYDSSKTIVENFYNNMYDELYRQYDIDKQYKMAYDYARSTGRQALSNSTKTDAINKGFLSDNSDLEFLSGYFKRKPKVTFNSLPKSTVGLYKVSPNEVIIDPAQASINSMVPYHEFLHSLGVGRLPSYTGVDTNNYQYLLTNVTRGNKSLYPRFKRLERDIETGTAFYKDATNGIFKNSARSYIKDPQEAVVHGLEEGAKYGIPPFAPYPGRNVVQKAYFDSLKHSTSELTESLDTTNPQFFENFWKLLTGNFLPMTVPFVIAPKTKKKQQK